MPDHGAVYSMRPGDLWGLTERQWMLLQADRARRVRESQEV